MMQNTSSLTGIEFQPYKGSLPVQMPKDSLDTAEALLDRVAADLQGLGGVAHALDRFLSGEWDLEIEDRRAVLALLSSIKSDIRTVDHLVSLAGEAVHATRLRAQEEREETEVQRAAEILSGQGVAL